MHFSILQKSKTLVEDKQIITSLKKNCLGKVKNLSIQNWKRKNNKSEKTAILCCSSWVGRGNCGYTTTV